MAATERSLPGVPSWIELDPPGPEVSVASDREPLGWEAGHAGEGWWMRDALGGRFTVNDVGASRGSG